MILYIGKELKQRRTEPTNSSKKKLPPMAIPYNLKKQSQTENNNNKIQNLCYSEIENLLKHTNKNTLKKYRNNFDKRIKYLKFMNSQNFKH